MESHLLELCRYIVLNPVRAGMTLSHDIWQWSSYRATAGLASNPDFLSIHYATVSRRVKRFNDRGRGRAKTCKKQDLTPNVSQKDP